MDNVAIYGFGGFGREIASIIQTINLVNPKWNIIGFFDDGVEPGTANRYGKVLGGLETLNTWSSPLNVVLAIASPAILKKLTSEIDNPYIRYPNIVAPTVLFFDAGSVNMGQGNVLCHSCRVSCDVKLGDFNLLNGAVSLGHDVEVGNFNVMQPELRVSGETTIGDSNFFGVRALVLQGLKIGNQTRIGTGSIVMRNTKDGMTYFGVPAKIFRSN